jgi:hypothetical protein
MKKEESLAREKNTFDKKKNRSLSNSAESPESRVELPGQL